MTSQLKNSREPLPLQSGWRYDANAMGFMFWHDLGAPLMVSVLAGLILGW